MSQRSRYGAVIIGAVLLSLGGIAIGAWVTKPADGGRGGAIAVALAFLILFVRRDYGGRVYNAILKDFPDLKEQIASLREGKAPAPVVEGDAVKLNRRLIAIVSSLNTEADGQKRQNRALAWASCVGTVAWGFGDIAAAWLRHLRC
jgi:hypothetical protein